MLDLEAIRNRQEEARIRTRERVEATLGDILPLIEECARLSEWLRRIEEVTDPAAAWCFANTAIHTSMTYDQYNQGRRER